jgi:helicase
LVKEGYEDETCLKEAEEEALGEILPARLIRRIKERREEEKEEKTGKEGKDTAEKEKEKETKKKTEERQATGEEEEKGTERQAEKEKAGAEVEVEARTEAGAKAEFKTEKEEQPQRNSPVLLIDRHRPDRIIFEGKEVKVTALGFSLMYLLSQHRGEVVTYEDILKQLWKGEEDAIYTRINYHVSKLRKDIAKAMDPKSRYAAAGKIASMLRTIPGRGLMLDIKE